MKIDNADQFLRLLNLYDWTTADYNDRRFATNFFNDLQKRTNARAELDAISLEVTELTSALADKHYKKCRRPYGTTIRGWGTEYVYANTNSQREYAEELISYIIHDDELVDLINKARAREQAKKHKDEIYGN